MLKASVVEIPQEEVQILENTDFDAEDIDEDAFEEQIHFNENRDRMDYYGRDSKNSIMLDEKINKISEQILAAVDPELISKQQLLLVIEEVLKKQRQGQNKTKCDAFQTVDFDFENRKKAEKFDILVQKL